MILFHCKLWENSYKIYNHVVPGVSEYFDGYPKTSQASVLYPTDENLDEALRLLNEYNWKWDHRLKKTEKGYIINYQILNITFLPSISKENQTHALFDLILTREHLDGMFLDY